MRPMDLMASLLTSVADTVDPTKDKASPFMSHHLTSGLGSARIARSATAKSWGNGERKYKKIRKGRKEGGIPLSFVDPSSYHRPE